MANQTASRNPFGQYYRNRTFPSQPNTADQIAARAQINSATVAWQSITDSQRQAWNEYAVKFPRVSRLGVVTPLSGFGAFCSAYIIANVRGLSLPFDPPIDFPAYSLSSAAIVLSPGSLVVSWVAAGGADVSVYLTPPTSGARAYSSASRPRFISNFTSTPQNLTAAYTARFGALPVTGQAVYFLAREQSALHLSSGLVARGVM